jgi:uncharacterized membrane protein YdjX (TVP38/TMEM64 family)
LHTKTSKKLFVLFWLILFTAFLYYISSIFSHQKEVNPNLSNITLVKDTFLLVAEKIESLIKALGIFGPIVYIVLYIIRPLVLFPAVLLTAVSGAVFGPIGGSLLSIIGENFSANFAFLIARKGFVKNDDMVSKHPFLQKINHKSEEHGFYYIFLLRNLYMPFDLLNYGAGLTKIKWKDYALGTFFGILPGLLTFTILGSSTHMGMSAVWLSGVFFIISLLIGFIAKRLEARRENLKP